MNSDRKSAFVFSAVLFLSVERRSARAKIARREFCAVGSLPNQLNGPRDTERMSLGAGRGNEGPTDDTPLATEAAMLILNFGFWILRSMLLDSVRGHEASAPAQVY
jgi:hypothetical protein